MNQTSSNLQKYQSSNPFRKFLIKRFLEKIKKIYLDLKPESILDAGCGEGMTIQYLGRYKDLKTQFYGIDFSEKAIASAKKIAPFAHLSVGSIYELPFSEKFFDLVICSEVLEHLENPSKALLELKRVAKKSVLLSVPNEPWFRIASFLSGKYLKTWGNHPEHINHWSKNSFLNLVKNYFTIKQADTSFPWTIILGEKI